MEVVDEMEFEAVKQAQTAAWTEEGRAAPESSLEVKRDSRTRTGREEMQRERSEERRRPEAPSS